MTTPLIDSQALFDQITDFCCSDMSERSCVKQISPVTARQQASSPFICPSVPSSSLSLPVFPLTRGRLLFAVVICRHSHRAVVVLVEAVGGDVRLLERVC